VVVPTAEYVRLASHYGFAPDFCHADDAQSKGIVENLCGYSQRDLAVPLLTEAAIAGTTVDLRQPTRRPKRGVWRSTPPCIRRSWRCPMSGSGSNANCWDPCRRCA
jgi:transposase